MKSDRQFGFPRRQQRQVVSGPGPRNLQVVLIEDLFAAVSTKKDPSVAWARVLTKKWNGKLKLCCRKILVVNRNKNISIDAGTYIKIEWIDGEYQPYCADCPGDSVSEDSDCSESL
jgi:hypothetical protein